MENLHDTVSDEISTIDAYTDFERWDIETSHAVISSNRLSYDDAEIDAYRMDFDTAYDLSIKMQHDAALHLNTLIDTWSDYRHDYTKCGLCGSHTEIKSLQLLQQGERKWVCAGCDNVVFEEFER